MGDWASAIEALLGSHTIGKLILRGHEHWTSALFSTSPITEALLKFKGQGRVTQVHKAGVWPGRGADKVLQLLQNKIEIGAEVEAKGERRKRKRNAKDPGR